MPVAAARALRLLLILALLIGIAAALRDRFDPPIEGMGRAIDGDSLRLDGEEIRLSGIDAPEFAQVCGATGKQHPCGREARRYLQSLLDKGPARCAAEGRDRYDRLLATCSVAGADIGSAIIRAGHAVANGAYLFDEVSARAAKRGIWAGPFQTPSEWRKDNNVGLN